MQKAMLSRHSYNFHEEKKGRNSRIIILSLLTLFSLAVAKARKRLGSIFRSKYWTNVDFCEPANWFAAAKQFGKSRTARQSFTELNDSAKAQLIGSLSIKFGNATA